MDKSKEREFLEITNRAGLFTDSIGVHITRVEDGAAESEVVVTPRHINPIGTVHGGVLVTMMDQAAGTASASVSPRGATVSCDVHFLSSATEGKLTCRAEVIRQGGRINVIHARVRDEKGTVIADGTYTFSHPKE